MQYIVSSSCIAYQCKKTKFYDVTDKMLIKPTDKEKVNLLALKLECRLSLCQSTNVLSQMASRTTTA